MLLKFWKWVFKSKFPRLMQVKKTRSNPIYILEQKFETLNLKQNSVF